MGRLAGNIIFRSLGGPVERYTPMAARVRARTSQKGSILFLDNFFILGFVAKLRRAGGGARGAQRPVWWSSKRLVRAAQGRAGAAKTH